jgi:hypothetical protein
LGGPLSGGGADEQVIESVFLRNFFVTRYGIYYMKPEGLAAVSIRFVRSKTGKERVLTHLTKTADLGISVSPDERWLLYSQNDQEGMDIVLAEGFQ